MILRLGLLFILLPLIELAILVYLGTVIGTLYTIITVIGTGILGIYLARVQGMATLSRIRYNLACGIMPSSEIFDGFLILLGALLLIVPGLITDAVGVVLLIPLTRRFVKAWIRKSVQRRFERGEIRYWQVR